MLVLSHPPTLAGLVSASAAAFLTGTQASLTVKTHTKSLPSRSVTNYPIFLSYKYRLSVVISGLWSTSQVQPAAALSSISAWLSPPKEVPFNFQYFSTASQPSVYIFFNHYLLTSVYASAAPLIFVVFLLTAYYPLYDAVCATKP